jgi:transposase
MSQKLNSKVAVIGIDIGKNSLHIVGQDRRGALVLRQKWSRGQAAARLANLPPCLIGMEGLEVDDQLDFRATARSAHCSACRLLRIGSAQAPYMRGRIGESDQSNRA